MPFSLRRRKPAAAKAPAGMPDSRSSQIRTAFTLARQFDPAIVWWMLLAFLLPIVVGLILAFVVGPILLWIVLGLLVSFVATTLTFTRRAQRAMFSQVEGQEGAVGAALTAVRGWTVEREPIAIDPRSHDMIFRASGRGGVVLVTEGPTTRVRKLVDAEKKRLARIVPSAPVHVINAGDAEGQVALRKLSSTVQRIRPTLSKAEAAELTKKLQSLGGLRPPVPKGMDPNLMRMSARRMRRG